MKKVMFVCTGNTCRSPMAELMFKKYLNEKGVKGVTVISRGLLGGGKPISINSALVLKYRGIDARKFTSKLVSKEDYDGADFVFTMTEQHKQDLINQFGARKNLFTINEVAGGDEIFDPYHQEEEVYEQVACLIEVSLPALAEKIK